MNYYSRCFHGSRSSCCSLCGTLCSLGRAKCQFKIRYVDADMGSKKSAVRLAFLIFVLAAAMLVGYVSANFAPVLPPDNIIIESDGAMVGTDKIVRNGDTYTFVGDVSGTKTIQGNTVGDMSCALGVYRSNIIIDGAGFTLQSNGIIGIDISNGVCQKPSEREVWNVTVKNLRIMNCSVGIRCEFGGNHAFYGNYISNNFVAQNETGGFSWENLGIALWGSSGNNITLCTIGGSPAIYMHFGCSGNIVTENNIVFGAHLAISGNETFDRNYWSDYSASYPHASEVDSSGVWNTPYAFADSTDFERTFQDNHPLMSPISIPNFSSILPTIESSQEFAVFPMVLAVSIIIVVAGGVGSFFLLQETNFKEKDRRICALVCRADG
jgi:hypothetical protein